MLVLSSEGDLAALVASPGDRWLCVGDGDSRSFSEDCLEESAFLLRPDTAGLAVGGRGAGLGVRHILSNSSAVSSRLGWLILVSPPQLPPALLVPWLLPSPLVQKLAPALLVPWLVVSWPTELIVPDCWLLLLRPLADLATFGGVPSLGSDLSSSSTSLSSSSLLTTLLGTGLSTTHWPTRPNWESDM